MQGNKDIKASFSVMNPESTLSSFQQVELLRRQYLQMLEPDKLTLPSTEVLRLPQTQENIFDTLFNRNKIPFLPPDRYQFRTLKKIINALEQSIVEPEEDVGFPLSYRFILDHYPH